MGPPVVFLASVALACAGPRAAVAQNLRRSHHDLATDVPGRHRLRTALDNLPITM